MMASEAGRFTAGLGRMKPLLAAVALFFVFSLFISELFVDRGFSEPVRYVGGVPSEDAPYGQMDIQPWVYLGGFLGESTFYSPPRGATMKVNATVFRYGIGEEASFVVSVVDRGAVNTSEVFSSIDYGYGVSRVNNMSQSGLVLCFDYDEGGDVVRGCTYSNGNKTVFIKAIAENVSRADFERIVSVFVGRFPPTG